jgi:hypothetical protein
MDDFARRACEAALRRMFRPNWHFDICTVDSLVKVTKIVPPKAEYEAMRLLHCVDWREMDPDLRDEAVRRLLAWFELPAFDPFAPVASLSGNGTPKGLFRRLLT